MIPEVEIEIGLQDECLLDVLVINVLDRVRRLIGIGRAVFRIDESDGLLENIFQ